MKKDIKEIRRMTGMNQREFAENFGIPLSTLRKWEQGISSPAQYVTDLILKSIPAADNELMQIKGRDDENYYYDKERKILTDSKGTSIRIDEDLDGGKPNNLRLYISDLFDDYYEAVERFERDCRYDKEESINWI